MANDKEFTCIDEMHYIHLGENSNGKPCNSSIGPSAWGLETDTQGGWLCLGCQAWWAEMPTMEEEGLQALRHMHSSE